MINFATLKGFATSKGNVTQIAKDGVILWALSGGKIVLEVEKITSDTYAAETTYTGEQFILLNIYPKTNGTVKVTYGSLTKTITDTSGAAEPNAQKVFFGTFNGVSDGVTTPASGTLTIEGDCYAYGVGSFEYAKLKITECNCVTAIAQFGDVEIIPNAAFANCSKLTIDSIPEGVSVIRLSAFRHTGITNVNSPEIAMKSIKLPKSLTTISSSAFCFDDDTSNSVVYMYLETVTILATNPPTVELDTDNKALPFGQPEHKEALGGKSFRLIVPKGCGAAYKSATGWSNYADYIVEAS